MTQHPGRLEMEFSDFDGSNPFSRNWVSIVRVAGRIRLRAAVTQDRDWQARWHKAAPAPLWLGPGGVCPNLRCCLVYSAKAFFSNCEAYPDCHFQFRTGQQTANTFYPGAFREHWQGSFRIRLPWVDDQR